MALPLAEQSDTRGDALPLKNGTTMTHIRPSTPADGPRVLEIWRSAIDATHDFLSAQDRQDIEREVADLLPAAPLWLALDGDGRPCGFMLVHEGHMETLFVDAAVHGKGIGRALVAHALLLDPALTTDVNEQNHQAAGFYERLGFRRTGRSERDGQRWPYPLIHLRYTGAA
jgi:putative acetyltransferase